MKADRPTHQYRCWNCEMVVPGRACNFSMPLGQFAPCLCVGCLTWCDLVHQAEAIGYTVELVEYCESHLSPGLLGAGLGVCIYGPKLIRIRQGLTVADRCFVLEHELEHARNDDKPKTFHRELDDAHFLVQEGRPGFASYLYLQEAR